MYVCIYEWMYVCKHVRNDVIVKRMISIQEIGLFECSSDISFVQLVLLILVFYDNVSV